MQEFPIVHFQLSFVVKQTDLDHAAKNTFHEYEIQGRNHWENLVATSAIVGRI